ncbi:MAG: hypothetical protein QOJ71_1217 [Actinomycetota bacterium]|nr:hypothetical protein [Actinomycetota bacterium]
MTSPRVRRILERAPIVVFAAVESGALVLYMVLGRRRWFYNDEWDFLVTRRAGDVGDLFRPHNEHWSTLPVLLFRGLYGIFGLHTYFPYQLFAVVSHLTAAALLFVVMLRARVRPWIATSAASLFVLFGSGAANITRAFQIGFTGALVFGLAHLILADHDGPIDRRDGLGLLAGVLGLMMSGVAVAMVIVVGLVVLARRGWRAALFHVVPPAVCYGVWFAAIGHEGYTRGSPTARGIKEFVSKGLRHSYALLGDRAWVGSLFAVTLITGLTLAVVQARRSGQLAMCFAPLGLLAGSVLFLVITATGRASSFGSTYALQPRYAYLVAAMTLPALAVAADALASRRRWLLPFAMALFLVSIPGNVRAVVRIEREAKRLDQETRRLVISIPIDPRAHTVPRSLRPETAFSQHLTVGWILDQGAHHELPSAPISKAAFAVTDFRLSFDRGPGGSASAACKPLEHPMPLRLKPGDVIGVFDNPLVVRSAKIGMLVPLLFRPTEGSSVVVLRDPGPVIITPRSRLALPRVCLPTGATRP